MQTPYYDYDDPQRFENVEAFVQAHNRGYMVLDDRRNNGWTPGYPTQGTFLIGETPVTVVQRTPGLTTYHWARKPYRAIR